MACRRWSGAPNVGSGDWYAEVVGSALVREGIFEDGGGL
jgi:hypothetical protein